MKATIKKLFKNSLLLLCIVLFSLITFSMGIVLGERRYQWAVDEVKEYRENYKFLTGWSKKIGDFQLVTFDGGKNWYNYKYEKDKGLIVLGVADPKVIRYQERMRDFIERAKRGEKPILLFYEEEK